MKALTADLPLPQRFTHPEALAQPRDFNVNAYFGVLQHLSLRTGYTLDWVYFSDDLGGKPIIYARPLLDPSFATYRDFLRSFGEEPGREKSYDLNLPHAYDFLEFIVLDDSAESYFELVMLAIAGDQFHLYWHGQYNDFRVICDESDISPSMNGLDHFELSLPTDVLNAASDLAFPPHVALEEDSVGLTLLAFTKWGGFLQYAYQLRRTVPIQVINAYSTTLVQYDCGVRY